MSDQDSRCFKILELTLFVLPFLSVILIIVGLFVIGFLLF